MFDERLKKVIETYNFLTTSDNLENFKNSVMLVKIC